MSLLSPERVCVGFAPRALSALRLAGRLRPAVVARTEIALAPVEGDDWEAPIAALELLLEQPGWHAHALTVLLSSDYVHYQVTPRSRPLHPAEQRELAHLVFREAYGPLSRDWAVQVSPTRGEPTLASALPRAGLERLRACCAGRGRLRHVQPVLMAVFNRARPAIETGSGVLALVERERTCLARVEGGRWQSVQSRAAAPERFAELLADECAMQGRPPGGQLWLADLAPGVALPPGAAWTVRRIAPRAAAGTPALADWGGP